MNAGLVSEEVLLFSLVEGRVKFEEPCIINRAVAGRKRRRMLLLTCEMIMRPESLCDLLTKGEGEGEEPPEGGSSYRWMTLAEEEGRRKVSLK